MQAASSPETEEGANPGSAQRQIPGAIAQRSGEALQPSLTLLGAGRVETALALAPMDSGLRALVDRIGVRFGMLGHRICPPKPANLIRSRVDPRYERCGGQKRGFTQRRGG